MDAQSLSTVLSELRFTAPLTADALDAVAKCSVQSDFPSGRVVFREGDENRNLYLVVAGAVALDMQVPGRGSVRILSLGPGDMLAWSALLGGGPMTATATALEETRLISIDAGCLHSLCDSNPQVGYDVMRQMAIALSRRLLATRLQLLDLFGDT